jgi:hypothetical protein
MKKLAGVLTAVIALATVGLALNLVGSGTPKTTSGSLVSSTGLTANTNYILDVNSNMGVFSAAGDVISAQLNVASATFPTATFKDGAQSTGSITVVTNSGVAGAAGTDTLTVSISSALVPQKGAAKINIASNSVSGLSTSSITIVDSGVSYTFLVGREFSVGASSNATATNLANIINLQIPDVSASVTGGTVTVACTVAGSFCDSYTIRSGTVGIRVSQFQDGYDAATFTLNGYPFVEGQQWTADVNYASNTAVSIKSGANLATAGTGVIASTTAATVVTLSCSSSGTLCNTYTLTSSTKALAVGGATFSGGKNQTNVTIGPFILQQGSTQGPFTWTVGANAGATAINISSAIMNTPSVAAVLQSTTVGGGAIVYATSVANGTAYNYVLSVTTPALTVSGPAMAGGVDPAYALNGTAISLPSTTFTTGLQVVYSTATSGSAGINGLGYGTTYYIGVIDANHVGLGTSLANAQAGTFVTLASSRTSTSAQSFTLAPLPITGTASFIWQSSDDGINFANITSNYNGVAVSSASLVTPYTATSFTWDFGTYSHRYLNLKATAPTTGAAAFTLYLNVKSSTK